MCGIVGKITFSGEHEPLATFDRSLRLIDHRGPDDRGMHHTKWGERTHISLGHTRLSVLDLSPAGHQPMFSPRTGACVLHNGEIYNFRYIRESLIAKGFKFISECDTEVVLASYDDRPDAFLDEFRGMFAIAIWDPKRGRLVLARDRLGIKPLYYYWDGRQFAFASELTALVALPTLQLDVSQDAIHQYLLYGYIPYPLSIFKNIRKLPAGYTLTLDVADPRPAEHCYWDALNYYADPLPFKKEDDVIDALREALEESVRLRLISDVPLGAFLSGGIDSSLVVAIMRKVHTGAVRTFTIGFTAPEWNEAPAAKRIAEHLGAEHEEFYFSEENILDVARNASDYYDEPFADESNIPTLALSRMTRQRVTVALSGDGGDELFWGYPRFNDRYLHAYGFFRAVPGPARRALADVMMRLPNDKCRILADALRFHGFSDYYLRPGVGRAWICAKLHRFPSPVNRMHEIGNLVTERLAGRDRDTLTSAMELKSYLVDDVLTKVDRASMSIALEVRVPLLDHQFVQLAARVPSSFKTANGELKHLLRVLLGQMIPRKLWDRPKMGFGVPLVHWFRSTLKEWAYDELESRDHRLHDWLDRQELHAIMEAHVSGRANHSRLIWACLQLAGWDRRIRRIQSQAHIAPMK